MALLQPNRTFLSYREVSAALLREMGIEVLLLDIDNTLAPYEQPEPDEQIRLWLQSLARAGIRAAFLSNNHGERVELFNKTLALPVRYDAHKPLPRQAKKMMKRLGGNRKNTALMGDQIFTDVLCAHLAGIRGFLVPPIVDRTDRGTRFKRRMERKILKRYYKKHTDAPDIRVGSPLTKEYIKT
ncbi:MAG: YqeG family HAD IIIA-type phosphatase [Clostridia bacterium]|nr:YqeG family HAD IIIA-type phosphatase [Clostridia bacterium]